jgi:hypothetical protein
VAWNIKLYQEWKGKNTKKANLSETTKNGEEDVSIRKDELVVMSNKTQFARKNFKLVVDGPIRFLRLWQLM